MTLVVRELKYIVILCNDIHGFKMKTTWITQCGVLSKTSSSKLGSRIQHTHIQYTKHSLHICSGRDDE